MQLELDQVVFFGTGVSVALDPRTVGTQIDDSIMQKSIAAKILAKDKKYFLLVKNKSFGWQNFYNW